MKTATATAVKESTEYGNQMKYKSKLKRNSKYNPHSKRFTNHILIENSSIEACEAKVKYLTFNKAKKAKKAVEKNGNLMSIYKCPHCKHFHLTTVLVKE